MPRERESKSPGAGLSRAKQSGEIAARRRNCFGIDMFWYDLMRNSKSENRILSLLLPLKSVPMPPAASAESQAFVAAFLGPASLYRFAMHYWAFAELSFMKFSDALHIILRAHFTFCVPRALHERPPTFLPRTLRYEAHKLLQAVPTVILTLFHPTPSAIGTRGSSAFELHLLRPQGPPAPPGGFVLR